MADHEVDAPEEWRPVPFPEYSDKYQVSSHGRVRKILKTWVKASGHVGMALCRNDTITNIYVHRLVAMAFISSPPSPSHEVAHRNGNPADNRLANLCWSTSSENTEDQRRHGTMVVGERHYKAKLTAEQVSEIRALYALGGVTHEQLGVRFGVHHVHISAIILRKKWRHVGREVIPSAATEVDVEDGPEEWLPVPFPEFAGMYFVSSHGRCARLLKPGLTGAKRAEKRYAYMTLTCGKKHLQRKVSRFVALAFLGSPPTPKHVVAHGNGNSQDDRVSNLRWATQSENRADARRHGTQPIGGRCYNAVITDEQALEIHALWAANDLSRQEIAARFGIRRVVVDEIVTGKTWKHLGITHEKRPRQGWSPDEETRAKLSEIHKGRKFSEETLAKMSAGQRARKWKWSDEAKAKMSETRRGRKSSPEAVKKVADALRGRKLAPEVVEAMRGRRHSEETKRLISERALERSRRKREQSED